MSWLDLELMGEGDIKQLSGWQMILKKKLLE